MSEAMIMKLIDVGLTAAAIGLERESILGRVTELQAQGATPEEIADALVRMRDDAINAAQGKLDRAS
jgi:hypothetical protein